MTPFCAGVDVGLLLRVCRRGSGSIVRAPVVGVARRRGSSAGRLRVPRVGRRARGVDGRVVVVHGC